MPESVPGSSFDPFHEFDRLAGRFLGGRGPGQEPGAAAVDRVDVSSLFSAPAREMFAGAVERAAARGSQDLGSADLLAAAAASDRGRSLLVAAGASPDALSRRIVQLKGPAVPGAAPVTLSPAVKRAVLDALRTGRALGAGCIGPEHLLAALAANRECTAAALLGEQGVSASQMREALDWQDGRDGQAAEPPVASQGASTPALSACGRDLTQQAREGLLDPVVGRAEVIDQAIEILSRRTRNNPCLVGEPGVGKTVIVEGIAQRVVNGDVPGSLAGRRVVALDLAAMGAGGPVSADGGHASAGDSAEPVRQLIDEIKAHADELLVFIDGLHLTTRAGPAASGAANLLKAALAGGELHVIGATGIDDYITTIETDAALAPRFQPLVVREPTIAETIAILGGLRDCYEAHHQVRITDEAIEAAARMSDLYIAGRFEPDKAVDLIDQAAARVLVRATTPPGDGSGPRHLADEARDVTGADVAGVVSRRTGIPVSRLTATEPDVLLTLEEQLHHRVIGQDEAVTVIAEAARRASAGLSGPGRPAGSFLFAGPAGVGKSELARALAEVLFGGEDRAIRIDMSEFGEPGSAARLTGAHDGQDGHGGPGRLTDAVRRRPHSVVVLEEIGKAAPDVTNALSRILRDGRLTDGSGRTTDFSSAIIIMTTNVVADRILRASGPAADLREELTDMLRQRLSPELLDGFDEVAIFSSLDKAQLHEVVGLMLAGTGQLLAGRGVRLQVTDSAKDVLVEMGYLPRAGARQLQRTVRREVAGRLSSMLLSGQIADGDTATVGADGAKIVIGVRHGPVRVAGEATAPRPREPAASENVPAASENVPAGSESAASP